jgi:hypothetical protein
MDGWMDRWMNGWMDAMYEAVTSTQHQGEENKKASGRGGRCRRRGGGWWLSHLHRIFCLFLGASESCALVRAGVPVSREQILLGGKESLRT